MVQESVAAVDDELTSRALAPVEAKADQSKVSSLPVQKARSVEDVNAVALEPRAPYTVVVGSFPVGEDSLARLDALTERLTSMGYQVYHADVDLGSRGWWRRVLVGSYDELGEARVALARLQKATHEFDDARAVRSSTIRATVTTAS